VYSLAESVARNSLQTLMIAPPFSYLLDDDFMENNFTEKNTTATDPESDVDFSETGLFDEDNEPPVVPSGSKTFTVYEADNTTQVAPITACTSSITKLSEHQSLSETVTSTIITPSGKLVTKNSDMKINIKDSNKKLDTQAVPPNRHKSAAPTKRLEKIITSHLIPEDRKTKICDIMIYDIPIEWSYKKILNEFTAWGTTISATVKKQKKYQTVRVKIALSSLTVSSFDKGLWSYTLGKKVVQWYPRAWTLTDRKTREKFQLVIDNFPEGVDTTDLYNPNNASHAFITNFDVKAAKLIKTQDGKRKFIGFFESHKTYKAALTSKFSIENQPFKWTKNSYPQEQMKKASQKSSSRSSQKASVSTTLHKSSKSEKKKKTENSANSASQERSKKTSSKKSSKDKKSKSRNDRISAKSKKDKKLTAVLTELLVLLTGEEQKLKEKRRFRSRT
jgi:hypothetical protein